MEKVTLNNGIEMPILGFGVYRIKDLDQCEQCVSDALAAGYRLIDTAIVYGNEEAVGKAVRRSGIPREELFITTKVWPNHFGHEKTKTAVETSLEKLDLGYIDLYLLHAPYNDFYSAWRVLEGFYKDGKIKAIGVSNFGGERLVDLLLNNEVIPAINQVELNPFHQQKELREVLAEYNIQTESWRPLGDGKKEVLSHETLTQIASKHSKTVTQVMLRWQIQNRIVTIPKSVHKERIIENFNIWDFQLDESDMAAIAAMDLKRSSGVTGFKGSDTMGDVYGAAVAKAWQGI